MQELEEQLARYKVENERIARLRATHQKELQKLQNERAAFEQHRAAEMARFKAWEEAETKKLAKNKRIIDRQMRANSNHTERSKERQELEACREELETLKRDSVQKDTKWRLAVERFKQKTETQSAQLAELREELKLSERLRLEAEQKAVTASPNTKRADTLKDFQTRDSVELQDKNCDQWTEEGISKVSARGQDVVGGHDVWVVGQHYKEHNGDLKGDPEASAQVFREGSESSRNQVASNEGHTQHWDKARENEPTGTVSGPVMATEKLKGANQKVEQVLEDGRRIVVYSNGTRKEIFPEGDSVIHFVNGDTKQVLGDRRVVYFYAEARTTQTTHPDGTEEYEFADGQCEKHFPDGSQEVIFGDSTRKYISATGQEETHFPDGTIERL